MNYFEDYLFRDKILRIGKHPLEKKEVVVNPKKIQTEDMKESKEVFIEICE
jgi:hypothetical protein